MGWGVSCEARDQVPHQFWERGLEGSCRELGGPHMATGRRTLLSKVAKKGM